jgi:chromosome segregation ATPase
MHKLCPDFDQMEEKLAETEQEIAQNREDHTTYKMLLQNSENEAKSSKIKLDELKVNYPEMKKELQSKVEETFANLKQSKDEFSKINNDLSTLQEESKGATKEVDGLKDELKELQLKSEKCDEIHLEVMD